MINDVVLVHGAWHRGSGFSQLVTELDALGITSTLVELSSVAEAGKPIGDMYRDAGIVRSVVDKLGRDCVVLAHSYGGLPVTQGLVGASNVKGLIYLTAFVLDKGETLYQACGNTDPAWWVRTNDNRLTTANPIEIFYNTCTQEVAEKAASQLRTQSLEAFNQAITETAWREIDSTYIICERDNAIPVFAQEAMSQRCSRTLRIDTDHSPFLSAPKELAEMIKRSLPTLG